MNNTPPIVIKPDNWSRVWITNERDLPRNAIRGNFVIEPPLPGRIIAIKKESWGFFIGKIVFIALLSIPLFTLYWACSEWSKILAGRSVAKIYVKIEDPKDIELGEQERKSGREWEEKEIQSEVLVAEVEAAEKLNPATIKKIALLFTRAIHEQYTTNKPESNACRFVISSESSRQILIRPEYVRYTIGNKEGTVPLKYLFDAIDWHRPEKCWRSIRDDQWRVYCSKSEMINEADRKLAKSKSKAFPFITIYTMEYYAAMNGLLRNPTISFYANGLDRAVKERIFTSLYAAGGLSQLPPLYSTKEVTRSISLRLDTVPLIFKPGQIVVEDAFVSTTMPRGDAFNHPVKLRIKPSEVRSAGKPIEALSNVPKEKERLFPPRTRFFVNKVTFSKDTCLIEMDELPGST